ETNSVEDHHGCPRPRDARVDGVPHAWIENTLELAQRFGLAEDGVAQLAAVDRAIVTQQLSAKALGDSSRLGRARGIQAMHDPVRVDVLGAVALLEQVADAALAASDVAGQAKKEGHTRAVCYT